MGNSGVWGWLRLSLIYWLIAGLFGLVLRLAKSGFVAGFQFDYFLHAHSHVAMLGWVYMAMISGIIWLLFGKAGFQKPVFKQLLWATQIAIIGMLLTFPIQGYGPFSIAFSTLHILLSYGFAWQVFKRWRSNTAHLPNLTRKFLAAGLTFMVLSSLGPWALAYIGSQGLKGTPLYDQAIYFYLHFQYNGWFTFTLMGFWLANIQPKPDFGKKTGFWLLFLATFPAYGLSLLAFELPQFVSDSAALAATLQIVGFGLLFRDFIPTAHLFPMNLRPVEKWLYYIPFVCLTGKFLLQGFSLLPPLQPLAFGTRPVVIGFLHWVMLGFASTGLLFWFRTHGFFMHSELWRHGIKLFIAGFLAMEVLLFCQGMGLNWLAKGVPYYDWLIVAATLCLVAGVAAITLSQLKIREKRT